MTGSDPASIMLRFGVPGRVLLALTAAVQLMLPAVVVVADVQPGRSVAARVTAGADASGVTTHPDDCVYCQYLTHAVAPTASVVRLLASRLVAQLATPAPRPVGRARRVATAHARAPPTLS